MGTLPGIFVSSTLQLIVLLAAAFGALSYILIKVVVPTAQLITDAKHMLPFLKFLPILEDIAAEFGTNSGSTMKDQLNRVEKHAEEVAETTAQLAKDNFATNRASITEIQAALGTQRELLAEDRKLAREDRQALLDILRSGERVEASGILADASRARTEASGERMEAADAVVAEDLAETQRRADAVLDHEPPGAAADAASQSPEE